MREFIDEHRDRFGVEPICRTSGGSASAYYYRRQALPSTRALEDGRLIELIRTTHKKNFEAYGYRRTWKALLRAGERVPRCQVQRLMRAHGIQGAKRRGKPWRTTKPDSNIHRPDLVHRQFTAPQPNRLWVGLRCWEGVVSFAFVIDVFSRRVVGWQLAGHMRSTLVLDALRMALGTREHGAQFRLVVHSDRGSQGGFKRSSQRSTERSCDGEAKRMGVGGDGASGDALAGTDSCLAVGLLSVVRRAGGDRAVACPEAGGT